MNNLELILEKQRNFFYSGKTLDVNFRINQLKKLKSAIIRNENDILQALKLDLGKSYFEGYETEVGIVLDELNTTIKHLKAWAKDKKVKTPIIHFKTSSIIHSEPYGVVLNMAPWNYPFQLLMAPLVGIIAGGNCAMLKPSKYSKHTTEIMERIIKNTFDENYISVVEPYGGRDSINALLNLKFDYIFFTGSVAVGKIVMEKAAKYLTPVTLELGGKSPCIVHKDAKLKLAAKRIVWGKFLNAGQTCVAPDYLLVHKEVKDELLKYMAYYVKKFFGDTPENSEDFGRIINDKQFERLMRLLNKGKIITGGQYNSAERYIAPTIIDNITFEDEVMQEEIFGPIFPVIVYDNVDEVIKNLQGRDKSLALYLFTEDKEVMDKIKSKVSYGGGCFNDTIIHVSSKYAPFGGVGASGMGAYHGKASFDLFTHKKSILKKSTAFDIDFRYAPYKGRLNMIKKLMK